MLRRQEAPPERIGQDRAGGTSPLGVACLPLTGYLGRMISERSSRVIPRLVCRDPAAARIEETTAEERDRRWSDVLEEERS